jgi:HAD superfamily hydrolase (TIGR01509 family)
MPLSARAPARPVRVVFLDDGGVLNDNDRRAPEWRRLLGEFFVPRLGGSAAAWAEANTVAMGTIVGEWQALQDGEVDVPIDWWPRQDARWLRTMCEHVGIDTPADIAGTVKASQRYVLERVECAFSDAAPALRAMKGRGLTLHTASGGLSHDLEPYLRRMGVLELFDTLYGPDLAGAHKTSRRYYDGIVEHSGVDPRDAVVVDDSPTVLEWAAGCGFRAVHMDRRAVGSRFERIGSLDQLLPLLEA